MEQTQKLIQQLLDEIDSSVSSFNESVPEIQKQIFSRLQVLLKDLELSGDDIKNSVANIKSIAKLKSDIESIILNKNYLNQVADFTKAFNTVSILNDKYFSSLANDFKPAKVLEAIKTDAVDATVTQLTEAGINANVTEGIQELLRTNIRSGGKYTDLVEQMRSFILTDKNGIGALEQYTRTITTDSLNTYSAVYSDTAASGLGLEWFMFTGSMLKTSRPMCVAMHEDKYFHVSQIPDLIKGMVNGKQTPLGKNDLPLGFKDETTVANYTQLRNGWNCGHQFAWVTKAMVPDEIKNRLKGIDPEKEVFVDKSFIKKYPVKVDHGVFKPLIKATPMDFTKDRTIKSSHYDPRLNKINIKDDTRVSRSPLYAEKVIYHEVGHAIHFQKNIITFDHVNDEFKNLFNSSKAAIKGSGQKIHEALREKLRNAFAKNDFDAIEEAGMAFDVLGSLTSGQLGGGHTKKYYKNYNGRYMELFAHGNTLKFKKNEVMESTMPEVVGLLKEYFDKLYSNL